MKIKTLTTILILNITLSQVFNTSLGTEHNTIGEALQNATSGNFIQVSSGTYPESFTINIPITLEGDTGAQIDASNESNAISIMGDNITVRGFEITGSENTTSGIAVNPGSQNIIIENNK